MSELRYNKLVDTWTVIAVERARRPHDYPVHVYEEHGDISTCPFEYGNEDKTPPEIFAIRDPNTKPNTPGWKVRVIPNKYPAFRIEETDQSDFYCIYDKKGGFGAHEVVVETPDHNRHIENFTVDEIFDILTAYKERIRSLYMDLRIKYVQVFKNHGKDAGKSLVHSHSQIIALSQIPKIPDTIVNQSRKHFQETSRCLLCDEIKFEMEEGDRIVYENADFLAYCPYASLFPFQVRIVPKFHSKDFYTINEQQQRNLAEILQITVRKLHKSLVNPPFNMVIYTAPPTRDFPEKPDYFIGIDRFFHWFIDILPRIVIQAGFELGTGYLINPTPPEDAAKFLREVIL